ncbi:MAG: AMP-binding protein [Lysobacteraceae bacterium]
MHAVNAFAPLLDRLQGSAPRVLWNGGALDDAALGERVRTLADALAAIGIQRIASRLDNGPDWLVLDLAIRSLDAVHVPLPTFFSPAQIAHALASSGAGALIVPAGAPLPDALAACPSQPLGDSLALLRLDPAPTALPAGTACITYTSGTTGAPKGVCLDAASLLAVAQSLADAAAPLSPKRHLCLMPLSTLLENVAGLYAALISGAEIAVPPLAEVGYTGASGLDVPTLIACLHRYRPDSAILLPQLLLALVMAAEQGATLPDSLKFLAVGGGRVGPALLARAEALGLPVYEGYGLSECASVVCLNRPGAVRAGSVGRPLPHAKVSAIDGELFVEGVRCLGYLGEDGPPPGEMSKSMIATGDLGHIDADGFVHITGRRKNVFITSFGRNVSPEWVESELLQHPAFAQAIVHGEAQPFNVAIVWPRRADLDAAALLEALNDVNRGLPDYAQVHDIVRADAPFSFADGLSTSNGRPRRDAILARYRAAIDARYAAALESTAQGVPA